MLLKKTKKPTLGLLEQALTQIVSSPFFKFFCKIGLLLDRRRQVVGLGRRMNPEAMADTS